MIRRLIRRVPATALALILVIAFGGTLAAPARAQTAQPVAPNPAPSETPAEPTVGAVDPNTIVDLDPTAGVFTDPLPFDVPWVLRGPRTAETQAVTAKILGYSKSVNCPRDRPAYQVADPIGPAILNVVGTDPKFLLQIPALRVNRYYCFEITRQSRLTGIQRSQFQKQAEVAIDAALRKSPTKTETLPTADYETLRTSLIAVVKGQLGKDQILDVPADSFFKANTPITAVKLDNRVSFDTVLSRQDERQQALAELRDRQADAANRLTQLVTSDAYQKLNTELQKNRSGSVSLDEFLKGKPGALALATVDPQSMQQVALGLDPGTKLPNLDDIFASADLTAQVANLTATASGLGDLRQVIDALNQNQVLRAAAGLDDAAGRAALAALPDLAEGARLAVRRDLFTLSQLQAVLASREELIAGLAAKLDALLQEVFPVLGTTVAGYDLRASWYISADVGLGLGMDIDEVFTYVGANVYFRPVNKRAHLKWSDFRGHFGDEFRKRFALMAGLPYDQLDQPGRLSGVIQGRPLILGAGFRVNDLLRFTGGALIFNQDDPDPLVTSSGLTTTPFFSLSVDWDLRSTFTNLFSGLGNDASP